MSGHHPPPPHHYPPPPPRGDGGEHPYGLYPPRGAPYGYPHHPPPPPPPRVYNNNPQGPRGKHLPTRPPYYYGGAPAVDPGPMDLEHAELEPADHDKEQGDDEEEEDREQFEDQDDDEEEEGDEENVVVVKKGGRKKSWRDYHRYDFNKTEGRKRLKAADDALQQAQDRLEAAHEALQQARTWHFERLAHHKTVSEQVVDELLHSEAPRPWNKMYQRLLVFHAQHGHCLMSVRASTAKRILEKEKEQRKRDKKKTTDPLQAVEEEPTTTKTGGKESVETGDQEPAEHGEKVPAEKGEKEPAASGNKEPAENGNNKEPAEENKDSENTKPQEEPQQDNTQEADHASGDEHEGEDVMDADEIGALGRWAAMQRTHKKKGKLEDWKVAALERLGFVWDARHISWHTNYQELKEFQRLHGHLRVLPGHNKSLNRWIRFQLDNYRDFQANGFPREDGAGMNQQRVDMLEALGMDWRAHDERWIVLFHKLQQLASTQGHLRTLPEKQTRLIQFADRQRRAYKEFMKDGGQDSKDMTNERVLLLESINFPWMTGEEEDGDDQDSMKKMIPGTPIVTSTAMAAKKNHQNHAITYKTDDNWMKYYLKVKAFYNSYQHFHYAATSVDLPQSEIGVLQRWDAKQRKQYQQLMDAKKNKKASVASSSLTPERIELLQVLGFLQPNHHRDWVYQIAQLRRFHAEKGHGKVLLAKAYPNHPPWQALAEWAVIQRVEYRKYQAEESSKLTWDHVYELTTLGFNWTLTEIDTDTLGATTHPEAGAKKQTKAIPPPVTIDTKTGLPALKRKRGRPRKYPIKPPVQTWVLVTHAAEEQPNKKKRGRPRKSEEEKRRDKEAREAAKALKTLDEASPKRARTSVGEVSPKLAAATTVALIAAKGEEEKKTEPEEPSESATMQL